MTALVLEELKKPLVLRERANLQPASGEVVIQLKASALNRRDYWIQQGLYPGVQPGIVPGSDGAGIVVQTGPGVDVSWRGREVLINPGLDWGNNPAVQSDHFQILGMPRDGTFASEVRVPAGQLHARPSHLNWLEAAALPLGALTAYRALFSQGGLRAGETVLITGIGGGVAGFALQFAVKAGAAVWVTSSSPHKIQRAVELGAQGGFDYTLPLWTTEFSKIAGAPNLVIDSAAGTGYRDLIHLTAPGARIVNYGATAGPPEKLDMFKVFWKQLRLTGTTMGSADDFSNMLAFVEKHGVKPVIEDVFPLAEANRALHKMATSPQFGKYVLKISE